MFGSGTAGLDNVVIQFEPLEERLVRADDVRRRSYVERVQRDYAAWQARRISVEVLCERAGEALHAYADETLAALLKTPGSSDSPQGASKRLLEAFNSRVGQAGVSIRDVIADSSIRHAVAQRLQERLLRAEAEFRSALDARPSSNRAARQTEAPLRVGFFGPVE